MNVLSQHPWLLPLLAVFMVIAGLLLFALDRKRSQRGPVDLNRRFRQAMGETLASPASRADATWLEELGNRILLRSAGDSEVKILLARAGWQRKSDIAIFYAIQALAPVLAVTLASYSFFIDGIDRQDLALLFLAGCAAFLLPKRIVAFKAAARQERIAAQTPILVHLLRVLLSTGLSVEQSLRCLAVDTRGLLPDLAAELEHLLRRIEAGEDVSLAMNDLAFKLDVPAMTDLAMILEQTWRMGGSVLKSLADLSALIESRMETDIKEKVSKLSGKMTIVMMLFLFPALLVFLAAPGFMAIIQGLKHAIR